MILYVPRSCRLFARAVLLASMLGAGIGRAAAAEWPQFLGPNRDGTAPEQRVADKWPADGPPVLWTKKVGQGFSGPVVADARAVVFHRVGDEEVVECLDAATGEQKWRSRYPTRYRDDFGFDEGPRATPSMIGGRVYTFGAVGVLACWGLEDGGKKWAVDTKSAFHAGKGYFGPACSPLVENDVVVLNVGGRDGAGVVAFDRFDGKVRWTLVLPARARFCARRVDLRGDCRSRLRNDRKHWLLHHRL
jgi:hypothetical protein